MDALFYAQFVFFSAVWSSHREPSIKASSFDDLYAKFFDCSVVFLLFSPFNNSFLICTVFAIRSDANIVTIAFEFDMQFCLIETYTYIFLFMDLAVIIVFVFVFVFSTKTINFTIQFEMLSMIETEKPKQEKRVDRKRSF